MWSVFFVFLSYLDRNVVKGALDTEKESERTFSVMNGAFCAKMSIVGENFLYKVSDGAEAVRSVVSPAGRLVNCSITVDHTQVKTFMQECVLGLRGQGWPLDARFTRMDEARTMCREFTERSEVSKTEGGGDDSRDTVLKRAKRGFTYPGTLWCGAGNMADHYDQLGQFADTDSCCRTHDHCPHVIHAFSSNYGYTNFKWHSICHCDCDNALKSCLRKVNDSSSRVVGQAFFNVIGVPCFEFTYEEQCAERLWYGGCKSYEKFPIAVLKDAVPYDFGGIKVIDELTLPPPNAKASKKGSQEAKPESPTQPTMSEPEAPSLRNVVTAAEDFIKVLATVSTSQSSNGESDKGEATSSEKKKKKNKGKKKKTKKLKGKGKGRKRKLKAAAGGKRDAGVAVSPSGSKAEEVSALSNFLSDSRKHDQSNRNTNRVGDDEYELEGKDEPSNEVMKDEPAKDEAATSPSSPTTVQKSPAEPNSQVPAESPPSTTTVTVTPHENKKRIRNGRRKSKEIPPPPLPPPLSPSEELPVTTTDHMSAVSVFANMTVTPAARLRQQSIAEIQLRVSTASFPKVIAKVKRNRSKEGGDSERTKKGRKSSSASLIVVSAPQNSSVVNLPAIPLTGAPTAPPIPTSQQQRSRSPDVYRGENQVRALNRSFSLSKWRRSKKKEQRKSRRKALVSSPSINPHFSSNVSEDVSPTPDTRIALSHPEITTAMQETETQSEWRLLTTAALTVATKGDRHTARKRTKPREKAAVDALSAAASPAEQTEPVTFTAKPFTAELRFEKPRMTTSAEPTMSPRQWTVQKVKAQFARKKKRKAALLNRRQ